MSRAVAGDGGAIACGRCGTELLAGASDRGRRAIRWINVPGDDRPIGYGASVGSDDVRMLICGGCGRALDTK